MIVITLVSSGRDWVERTQNGRTKKADCMLCGRHILATDKCFRRNVHKSGHRFPVVEFACAECGQANNGIEVHRGGKRGH